MVLKILRKNTKLVIWAVVIAFCLWGGFAFGVQLQKQNRIAGEVFGREITFQEYNSFFKSSQIFSFSGKPLEDPEQIAQHAWQSLMLSEEGKREKVEVSDDDVRKEVLRLLQAQKIESPSQDLYERWLKTSFGLNPHEFENQVREILRIQKLLLKVNDRPLADEPANQEIEDRYFKEENRVTLSLAPFSTLEEAKAFYEEVKNKSQNWDKTAAQKKIELKSTGESSLAVVTQLWGIPEDTAKKLLALEPSSVGEPLEQNGKFVVIKLVDKKPAKQPMEEETKKKYLEKLVNQKKYERLLSWNSEVLQKANLKDFTPKPEPPPPSNPESAPLPEQQTPKP